MRLLDAPTTRAALPFGPLIEALRRRFAEGCEVPLRHVHQLGGTAGEPAGTVLLMPAWRAGGPFALKTVTIFPGNGASGLPAVHAVVTLFDGATGVPLAVLDGSEVTARRTAAASALAAGFLARDDAKRLLVVGAGRVAALMPAALSVVRPGLRQFAVWNHRPAGAEALAARWRAEGLDAMAVSDLQAAVENADIVSCATLSTAALVQGDRLAPGTHLDLIGSFTPAMREADGRCFARSRVWTDTEEAPMKSGDLLQAVAEGAFRLEALQGTLADLCRGHGPGREAADEITLFKSVGSALEDLAAAELALERTAAGAAAPAG